MENTRPNEEERISEPNWSERVEDLVAAGDVTAAISFLESLETNLQSRLGSSSSSERTEFGLQLAAALTQLADLYSSQGLSLKSDELRTRSSLIKQRALDCDRASSRDSGDVENQSIASNGLKSDPNVLPADGKTKDSTNVPSNNSAAHDSSDDDWEALADLEPSKLLPVEELPEISKLSVEEPKVEGPKRRGRGTFTYKRDTMYSDRDFSESRFDDSDDNDLSRDSEKTDESLKSKYGTRHVLVLADFSPSLRTTDLEKLFKDFKDSGFIIRWVNDITALAVFKTPSAGIYMLFDFSSYMPN
ncbi:RNA-binding domain superfamily [Arabidopsis thaliana x Arabidopsis arenosa]|uniref:RNA-binding domain superfamily n=1 Tax=Arabidopsis thaliana x Arabidopsis arenosa TaxID=1240361 RepID=A0A8T1YY27_9BRAS|nr:RNA-binding domain superfamily [Arabidopsis thaliana x Arabidopsis arenosa]